MSTWDSSIECWLCTANASLPLPAKYATIEERDADVRRSQERAAALGYVELPEIKTATRRRSEGYICPDCCQEILALAATRPVAVQEKP